MSLDCNQINLNKYSQTKYIVRKINCIGAQVDLLDISLGASYETKVNLNASFGLYETKLNLDSSFYDVYASIVIGGITADYVDGSISAAVDAVDTSLVTYTDAAITTALDASFALYETILNLDSSFALYETKINIDSSISNIELGALIDVSITGVQDGSSLIYEAGGSFWTYGTGGGAGATTLEDLSDTSVVGTTDRDVIQYYVDTSTWENVALVDASYYFVKTTDFIAYNIIQDTSAYIELNQLEASIALISVTFDYIDGSIAAAVDAVDTSLVTYTDAAITTALDASFALYETILNLDSSFALYETILNLDTSFALYETKVNLDSSFYDVYAAMGSGDVTKVYVDGSLATRDASINNNRAKINQLDASVVRIDAYNRIQDTSIYAEVNQIEASIANLDTSLDLYLPLTGGTLSGNLTLDNSLIFNDAYISVDNSIFTIKNLGAGGSISIEGQAVAGANRIIFTADPDSSVMIYHPGLGSGYDAKVMTQTDGINVRSTIYADNGTSKVGYGASNIQLLTEGRDSNDNFVIKHNSAGNISLESNNKTNLTINGSTASLAYFGLTKLQTTATGITVTGTITDYIKDSSFNPSDFVWNGVYLDVSTVGTGVSKDYVDGSIAAAVDAVDTSLVTYVDNVIQTGGGDVNWSEGNYGDVQEIVTAVGDGSILASAITTTGNTLDVRHLFGGALWTQYSYVGDIQGKLNASTGKTDLKINTTADGYGMIVGDTGTDHDLTVYGDVSVFGNLRVAGIFEGLDASFALYETILNLDSSFGLYKTKANLDSSFGLYKTKTNLDSSFGLYETKVNLDSSFYDVYASMGSGDVTKVYVDGSLATRDASINNNRAKINQLDTSVVRIDAYNRIQDTSIFIIDASVIRINAYNRIQDTSIYAEVNQIEASIANLDTSLDLYLPLTGGTCSGDITATDFNLPSDTRYKNIIKPVDNGLDILSNITPQVFTWKDNRDDYEHIGYIAQELNIVRPELVKWNKEGYATISYSKMSAINTAAILELNKEIADLKKRINILENASTGY